MNTQTAERPLAEAFAWFDSIKEMVDAWNKFNQAYQNSGDASDRDAADDVQVAMQQSVLSCEVRSGWYSPAGGNADSAPAEYRILLSTGGPAVQLVGELDEHGEPTSARLEHQDWFKPWTEVPLRELAATLKGETTEIEAWQQAQEILLTFARQFYFGEG